MRFASFSAAGAAVIRLTTIKIATQIRNRITAKWRKLIFAKVYKAPERAEWVMDVRKKHDSLVFRPGCFKIPGIELKGKGTELDDDQPNYPRLHSLRS